MDADVVVAARRVSHTYPGGVHALRDVSIDIRAGEFVSFVGRNGSGKTTLVEHFNGMLRPTNQDGQVLVRTATGRVLDTRRCRLHQLAPTVTYVFQNPDRQIFHDTCAEELAFGLTNIGVHGADAWARIAEALDVMALPGCEDVHPVHLSRGERQRLAIAATMVMRPAVIVVDEPTTGQDRREARLILERLRDYNATGRTVVVISHDMALVAEYATRVVAMRDGGILADGPPVEVFAAGDMLETTNITPPQVTSFCARLGLPGVLSVPEAVEQVKAYMRAGGTPA